MSQRQLVTALAFFILAIPANAQHENLIMTNPMPRGHVGVAKVYDTEAIRATRYVRGTTRDSLRMDGRMFKFERAMRMGNTDFVALHFGKVRTLGGLRVQWDERNYPTDVTIYTSLDDTTWSQRIRLRKPNGAPSYVFLPDVNAKAIALDCGRLKDTAIVGIVDVRVFAAEEIQGAGTFYQQAVRGESASMLPARLRGAEIPSRLLMWNMQPAAALDEEGVLRFDGLDLLLQTALYSRSKLIPLSVGKRDLVATPPGGNPGFEVVTDDFHVAIQTASVEREGRPETIMKVMITNTARSTRNGKLLFAVYPMSGRNAARAHGVSKLGVSAGRLDIDERAMISFIPAPTEIGGTTLPSGDISEFIKRGSIPGEQGVFSKAGHCSGGASQEFSLESGATLVQYVTVNPSAPARYYVPLELSELQAIIVP